MIPTEGCVHQNPLESCLKMWIPSPPLDQTLGMDLEFAFLAAPLEDSDSEVVN